MEEFLTDVVLGANDICNLHDDYQTLTDLVGSGKRVVFAGPRNTGKTSLVKGKVMPWFKKKNPKGIVVFVDLMGVKSLGHIDHLFTRGFETAYARAQPAKNFLQNIFRIAKKTRPTFAVDPMSNEISFSFSSGEMKEDQTFQNILEILAEYHSEYGALLILDEFQDIVAVPQGQARMRDALQNLPGNLPVLVLGSKKHLLAEIFARPKAPFANWGHYLEIAKITAKDYLPYINARLKKTNLKMTLEQVQFLLTKLQFIPECINLVCDYLKRRVSEKISEIVILKAIIGVIEERSSIYGQLFSFYSEKEQLFLRELAALQPLSAPYSAAFLARIKMSTGASRPLIKRLENDGIIVKESEGYMVSDPLLSEYLRRY